MAKLTKIEALRIIDRAHTATRFLGNVVLCHHHNKAIRLRGIAKLVIAGIDVRCAPFDMDRIWVDGYEQPWSYLEEVASRNWVPNCPIRSA